MTVAALSRPHPSGRSPTRGMSLIEVLVAMTLLLILGAGLMGSVIYSRRLAELEIYQSSVHTAVAGYLEQLKTMPYSTLSAAELGTLPTPLQTGQWNAPPPIDINRTPDLASDDIVFRVRPQLNHLLTDATAPLTGLQCYEMVLNYEYDSRLFGETRTYSGSLRLVRSFVQTF